MKFRKKSVVIEAFKWTGGIDQEEDPEWIVDKIVSGDVWFVDNGTSDCKMKIKTLEGIMEAKQGDWIIQGVKGELYPVKNEIFIETYERVD